jgi:ABC-type phosphate transport system substrate-binding protein
MRKRSDLSFQPIKIRLEEKIFLFLMTRRRINQSRLLLPIQQLITSSVSCLFQQHSFQPSSVTLYIITMKFSAASAALFSSFLVSTASAQEVISIHGSGTTNPSKCYWQIMDQMQIQAKLPLRMTYRGVGSSTGQAEFIGNVTHSDNMFGSGDIPIGAEDYAAFEPGSILHLPIMLGAISFFHSVPTGEEKLNLSPCLLAKIMNRKITDWTDAEVINENPNLADILPIPSPITVAHRVLGSSSTASITEYLHAACPDEWPEDLVDNLIEWPADTIGCEGSGGMTDCILATSGTIGYIDSGHGHAQNLQEIELLNAANNYISSKEAAEKGGILAAAENAELPATLDGDFSGVDLLNRVCFY